MALEAEPEKRKARKKNLRLWEPFYLSFISVNLKILIYKEPILDS